MSQRKSSSEKLKESARRRESDCLPVMYRKQLDAVIEQYVFDTQENTARHNPYDQEVREQDAIRNGDVDALEKAIMESFSGEIGNVSKTDPDRNIKDLCIVVITLATRSAIQGGVPADLAFSMSDIYINAIEDCRVPLEATTIARGAEYRYCRLVAEWKEKGASNPIENEYVERARDYIFHHLHGRITAGEIAAALSLNPSYLSTLFHKETGRTIPQYILHEKVRLVKNLLSYSDYTYLEIASYLGFSSQSHLGEVFRRETGMTLKEYRTKYQQRNFS